MARNRDRWLIPAFVLIGGAIAYALFRGQTSQPAEKKLPLAQIIPGATRAQDIDRLLGREEYSETSGEWAPFSGARFPGSGMRYVYVHYDKRSDKVDGLHLDLEDNMLFYAELKKIYPLQGLAPETLARNNRLMVVYGLEPTLILAVTYKGPTDRTPVMSLSFLTKDAKNEGLLSRLPNFLSDLSGEWLIEDPSGNSSAYISQNGERVTGVYSYGGGVLYGTAKGRAVELYWKQNENKRGGRARLTLSEDGKTLSGSWEYDPQVFNSGLTGQGRWTFRRK